MAISLTNCEMRAHLSGVHLLYSSTHNQLDVIIVSPISLSGCVAGGIKSVKSS